MKARRFGVYCVILVLAATLTPSVTSAPCIIRDTTLVMARSASNQAVIADCGSGGGGGGGDQDEDGDVFTRDLDGHGTLVSDYYNPLARFVAHPTDAQDTDRVVDLAPLVVPADNGNLASNVEAISNADIVGAMAYFGVTAPEIIQTIQAMVPPQYASARDEAIEQIGQGDLKGAVETLRSHATPMDVSLWCGPDRNPIELPWVIAIPTRVPCGIQEGAVGVYARVQIPADTLPGLAEFIQANPHARPADVTLTLQADGTPFLAGQQLVGFTYQGYGVGAWTFQGRGWKATIEGEQLHQMRAPGGSTSYFAPEWTSETGQYAAGDRLYFTLGDKLSRGLSIVWPLAAPLASTTSRELKVEVPRSAIVPTDDGYVRVKPALPTTGALTTVGIEFTTDGSTIAAVISSPARHVETRAYASAQGLVMQFQKADQNIRKTLEDTWELRATASSLGAPWGTVQVVGGPSAGGVLYRAPEGTYPGRLDLYPIGSGFFRTVLGTIHGGNASSSTSDYVHRVSMMGSDTAPNQNSADRMRLHGTTITATWWTNQVSRFAEASATSFLNASSAMDRTTGAEGGLWRWGAQTDEYFTPKGKVGSTPTPAVLPLGGTASRTYTVLFWVIGVAKADERDLCPTGVTCGGN